MRSIHDAQRQTINYLPDCAQPDPEVTYTLRPGTCTFENIEFKSHYEINSLGVRDDEDSLHQPKVIVLGDSVAMGWGVKQQEAFPQVLEKKTKLRTLNMGIASFGTAREMIFLNRAQVDNLRYLIIQYDHNDLNENKIMYEHKGNLPISQEQYFEYVEQHQKVYRNYFPGKYSIIFFKYLYGLLKEHFVKVSLSDEGLISLEDEVNYFLYALVHGTSHDLSSVQFFVVADEGFNLQLQKKIKSDEYPPYIQSIISLNKVDPTVEDYFYYLDDHWTAKGHKDLADRLVSTINRLNERRD